MTKFDKLFNYIKNKQAIMSRLEARGVYAHAEAWNEILAYAKRCNKKKKKVIKEEGSPSMPYFWGRSEKH